MHSLLLGQQSKDTVSVCCTQVMGKRRSDDKAGLQVVPPVKLLVKDFQLLLGLRQWQNPLDGFCQLEAVPAADARLRLVVVPATVIRVVADIAWIIPVQETIRPAYAPATTSERVACRKRLHYMTTDQEI